MAMKKTLSKTDKKQAYDKNLCRFLDEYSSVLIAEVGNVGSTQLAAGRRGIRGESEILMGKNTLIRCCIKVHAETAGNDMIKDIIPLLHGNVGLIFTKADPKEVREEVAKDKEHQAYERGSASAFHQWPQNLSTCSILTPTSEIVRPATPPALLNSESIHELQA